MSTAWANLDWFSSHSQSPQTTQNLRWWPTGSGAVNFRHIQYVAVDINSDEEADGKRRQPEEHGVF